MRISVYDTTTVGALLDRVRERYGGREELEAHVRSAPGDVSARLALHDLNEYEGDNRDKRIHERREIILPDDQLDELTVTRLQLLLSLKQLGGRARSMRRLAECIGRDIKNVSEDVHALAELGLLEVERRGPGRAHSVSLPGERVDLHLAGAPA